MEDDDEARERQLRLLQPRLLTGGILREYQRQGFLWMVRPLSLSLLLSLLRCLVLTRDAVTPKKNKTILIVDAAGLTLRERP